MIHVAIDTNVLRKDPLGRHATSRALERLGGLGDVKVHVPYFVEQEFLSQQVEQQEASLARVKSELSGLLRRPLNTLAHGKIERIVHQLEAIEDHVMRSPESDFRRRLSAMKAARYPFPDAASEQVFEAYFGGNDPFRERRSKKDIADAFIAWELGEIAKRVDHLCVVVDDQRLRETVARGSKVTCFSLLSDLLASGPIRQVIAEREDAEKFIGRAPQYVHLIEREAKPQVPEVLRGAEVRSSSIPEDNHRATVLDAFEPYEMRLDVASMQFYGGGEFVLPFQTGMEALLHYAIYIADYMALPDERSDKINVSSLNEHYYDAEEYYDIIVQGVIILKVHLNGEVDSYATLGPDELPDLMEVEVDHIDDISVRGDAFVL